MRKATILKIVASLAVFLGLAVIAIGFLIDGLISIDTEWFISRFGPNGEDAYRTYDKLYEMSKIIIKAANKYTMAFYVGLAIGLVIFGATCGLWASDIKRLQKEC